MPNTPDFSSVPSDAWTDQITRFLRFGGTQGGGIGYPSRGLLPREAPGTPAEVSGRVGYSGLPTTTMPTGDSVTNPLFAAASIPTSSVPPAPPQAAATQPPGSWFTPSNTPMPWNGPNAPLPPARPPTAATASSPAARSTATPIPPKRAAAAPVVSRSPNLGYYPPNPRFPTMQYQVPGSGRGPLSNAPIYTTMNLFGGGADKSASAASPRAPVPAPARQANAYPGDDIAPNMGGQDPTQMSPDQLAAAVGQPNWWQNTGGGVTASGLPNNPAAAPGAVASAVNKPNWWQSLFG